MENYGENSGLLSPKFEDSEDPDDGEGARYGGNSEGGPAACATS